MSEPALPQACPACHADIDILALVPWGDGNQTLPVAPWICAQCAALGLIEIATGRITLTLDHWWDSVRQRTPELWQQIVTTRARIRGGAA